MILVEIFTRHLGRRHFMKSADRGECFAPFFLMIFVRWIRIWHQKLCRVSLYSETPTYDAVHMPTAHMSTDGCEALSAKLCITISAKLQNFSGFRGNGKNYQISVILEFVLMIWVRWFRIWREKWCEALSAVSTFHKMSVSKWRLAVSS